MNLHGRTVPPYHLVKSWKPKYMTSSSSPSYWLHPIGSQRQGSWAWVQAEDRWLVDEKIWRDQQKIPGTIAFNFTHLPHAKTLSLLSVRFNGFLSSSIKTITSTHTQRCVCPHKNKQPHELSFP